jgi:hypothetical protein
MEAAVRFGNFLHLNAPGLWTALSSAQKQGLQKVFFPEGVNFKDGVFVTTKTSKLFFDLARVRPARKIW